MSCRKCSSRVSSSRYGRKVKPLPNWPAALARCVSGRAPLNLNDGRVLDTAGTGGDGAGTFNISTGAALVAASAGVPVAKHGNRAISGRVGAADVLERFGVRLELDPAGLRDCLARTGICFVFAPAYHPVLARLAGLRRALGIRTIFNLIAPLANPANPHYQLLGVAEPRLLRPIAEALAALEVEHAMVVHGNDGLDEISLTASTSVIEVRHGELRAYEISPEMFGLPVASAADFLTADVNEAMSLLERTLRGEPGPAQDVLALNAGAAIYVGNGAGFSGRRDRNRARDSSLGTSTRDARKPAHISNPAKSSSEASPRAESRTFAKRCSGFENEHDELDSR